MNERGQVRGADLSRFKNDRVISTISAFANENRDGGLLALGIESNGNVPGISHLTEDQLNSLAQLDNLVGHNSRFKVHALSVDGVTVDIALVYVPYAANSICQTTGRRARAWRRRGSQNIELTDEDLNAIKRDKHIVDYERTHCTRYKASEIDDGVYKEFSRSYLNNASYELSQKQLLDRLGAIEIGNDTWFTNSGKLFFSVNPERDIPQAFKGSFVSMLPMRIAATERRQRTTRTSPAH